MAFLRPLKKNRYFYIMSVSEIQLFNILRERVGEKEAQSLVEFNRGSDGKGV